MSIDPAAVNLKLEKILNKVDDVAGSTDHIARLLDRVTSPQAQPSAPAANESLSFWDRAGRANQIGAISLIFASLSTIISVAGYSVNRAAMMDVQRAFVSFSAYKFNHDESQKRFTVSPTWENSGTTPATSFVHFFSDKIESGVVQNDSEYGPNQYEPTEEEFMGPTERPKIITLSTVQSRGTVSSGAVAVPDVKIYGTAPPVVGQLNLVHNLIFFFGWGVYHDVFRQVHVTEFCGYLTSATGVPPNAAFEAMPCNHHNCEDDDCPDHKRIIELAKSFTK